MNPNEHVALIERTLSPLLSSLVGAATGIVRIEIVVVGPRESIEILLLTEGEEPTKKAHWEAIKTAELALRQSLPEGVATMTKTMPLANFADYSRLVEACAAVHAAFRDGRAEFSLKSSNQPISYAPGKTRHYVEWGCELTDDIPDPVTREQIIDMLKSKARELGYPAEASERIELSFSSREQWTRWQEENFP
jgi:hypothetical protein